MTEIADNLIQIKKEISSFEKKNQSVCLLAISKTKSLLEIEEAIGAGQYAFGENYVQEAIVKIQALKKYPQLEWHYIGCIQKNKIKDLAQYFDWVQTLEDQEVAKKLNQACEKIKLKLNVCVQVNISLEPQKGGLGFDEIEILAKYIVEECPWLCLRGLMGVGLATQDGEALRAMFCQLRCFYDDLKNKYSSVDTLSMGMSDDMQLAIACGSTMVRIGTAIFGGRK
jgi:pyridoxal phosphate enzyme (YggS family)